MVEQYPHTIIITTVTEPVQDEETGLFEEGTPTVYLFKCRAERNGGAGRIIGADGTEIIYSHSIYLPRMTTVIPVDSGYVLTMGEETMRGKVKGASNGQMNSRLWV
jgi:hypothetical protein